MPILPSGGGSGGREEIIKAIEDEKGSIKELLRILAEELAATTKGTQAYNDLKKELDENKKKYSDLNQQLRPYIEQKVKEHETISRGTLLYQRYSEQLTKGAGYVRDALTSYHRYGLEIQTAIDKTGRFLGQSAQTREEFLKLTRTLNLTRDSATAFLKSWSDAMRLGFTNQQLERMIVNLQRIHGHAQGLAMGQQILATPMAAGTMQGVAQGNRASIITAIRTANADQAQALIGMLRTPAGRPRSADEAARFENAQAEIARSLENVKMGMQAALASGFGPETAALITPVATINENVAKLVNNSNSLRQFLPSLISAFGGSGLKGIGGLLSGGIGSAISKIGGSWAGKMGLGALIGTGANFLGEYVARRAEPGSTAHVVGRGVGVGGRLAGAAFTGAAIGSLIPGIGTVAGGVAGGLVGVGNEWGKQIVEKVRAPITRWVDLLIGAVREFKEDRQAVELADVMSHLVAVSETANVRMAGLAVHLQTMPSALEAKLAGRASQVGMASINRATFQEASNIIGKNIQNTLEFTVRDLNEQIRVAQDALNTSMSRARASGVSPEELKRIEEIGTNTIFRLTENLQHVLQGANIGGRAQETMQRAEVRRGQVGLERQAAGGLFQLMGAVTGSRQQVAEYQQEITRTFMDESRIMAEESREAFNILESRRRLIQTQLDNQKLQPQVRRNLRLEQEDIVNQQLQLRRNVANAQVNLQLEKRNAELEALRSQITAFERDQLYRRSQQQQALARAQESFIRERGATPGEIGATARDQQVQASRMLSIFMKTFQTDIDTLNRQMEAARAGGDEARAILIEQEIFNLANKRVELERGALEARLHSATAEEQYRQEQIGAQKRILEIQRDAAGRIGMSWRYQMGIQSQIIRASQADLQSSRRELDQMAAEIRTMGGDPLRNTRYLQKLGDVTQKQAEVQEAILGRQRSFLEQAMQVGFGMGGGTKILPNINPRIFGEVIRNAVGMQQPGMPLTMQQQRGLLMQGAGGNVFGGVGLPAVPVRPGVGGGGIGPGGVPVVPGAAPGVPGGGVAMGGQVDVTGQIEIVVSTDDAAFQAKIRRQQILLNRPGMG